MKISKGKIDHPVKMVVYGTEGIGKTTLASKFPNPLFIDVENGSKELDVTRVDEPIDSWNGLLKVLKEIEADPTVCRTVVIDTIDAAELLLMRFLEAKHHTNNVEALDYGKGTIYIRDEMTKLLGLLDSINAKGCNIALIAHSTIRKFEKPDEAGAYDRYELKLTRKDAPLIKEWCDCLLFANYETMVISPSNKMEKKKIAGGRRMIYTTHHPAWDAKNRYGLAEKLPLEYESIKKVFEFDNKKVELDPKEVELAEENPSVRVSSDNKVEVRDKNGNILNDPDFTLITDEDAESEELREIVGDPTVAKIVSRLTEDGLTEADATEFMARKKIKPQSGDGKKLDDYSKEFLKKNVLDKWESFKNGLLKSKGA